MSLRRTRISAVTTTTTNMIRTAMLPVRSTIHGSRSVPLLSKMQKKSDTSVAQDTQHRSTVRSFSTALPRPSEHQKQSNQAQSSTGSDLISTIRGASRTTKIIVIVALSIAGTAETIFWAKVLWRRFFAIDELGPQSEDGTVAQELKK